MPAPPKKAATVVREVEHELADTTARIEQLRHKRESALLANDTNALDVIETTQARLEKAAERQQERLRLLHQQVQQEETEAVAKRRAALRERFRKRLEEADQAAVELQTALANVLTLFRKIITIREDCRASWPSHDAHTNAAAGTPEGAALSGGAVKALLANHLYRISCDPFVGGQPGERRQQSLPGAVCPRLDWQLTPDKITPFADALRTASAFAVSTMATTLDPLRALTPGQAVAPAEGDPRTEAETKWAALLKQQAELANDVSPEGEARYMAVVAELARLSSEAPDVFTMSPDQATAALAQKTAEYRAAQAPADAVPPPPAGTPATTPAQAAARLAQLRADPAWRDKVLTGSAKQAREFQELTTLAASGDATTDVLIETVDAVSNPSALSRAAYAALIDGLRSQGLPEVSEQYIRDFDAGRTDYAPSEGDGLAFKQALDRLLRDPAVRTAYLAGNIETTAKVNNLNRVVALAAQDGRPVTSEAITILTKLGLR
jgi:hypothetical protein